MIGFPNGSISTLHLEVVLGIDYSAVSQARKRLQLQLERDPKLKKHFVVLSDHLLKL
jgi:hypothetical protein